jgi:hypothetical protein
MGRFSTGSIAATTGASRLLFLIFEVVYARIAVADIEADITHSVYCYRLPATRRRMTSDLHPTSWLGRKPLQPCGMGGIRSCAARGICDWVPPPTALEGHLHRCTHACENSACLTRAYFLVEGQSRRIQPPLSRQSFQDVQRGAIMVYLCLRGP